MVVSAATETGTLPVTRSWKATLWGRGLVPTPQCRGADTAHEMTPAVAAATAVPTHHQNGVAIRGISRRRDSGPRHARGSLHGAPRRRKCARPLILLLVLTVEKS